MGIVEDFREYERRLEDVGCREGVEIARNVIRALES